MAEVLTQAVKDCISKCISDKAKAGQISVTYWPYAQLWSRCIDENPGDITKQQKCVNDAITAELARYVGARIKIEAPQQPEIPGGLRAPATPQTLLVIGAIAFLVFLLIKQKK
jgi:hypothetical protein